MKRILIILCVLAISASADAQQLPMYSQYIFNSYAINPAVGGSVPYYDVRSNNRYQWEGVTDAPRTYTLTVHGPLRNRKMGLGGFLYTDHVGPTRRTGLQFSYAYHLSLNSNDLKLSFGVSAGIAQFAIDASKITLRDEGDDILSNSYQSTIVPDAKFGLYLYKPDRFYVSLSAPQLIHNKLYFFDDQAQSDSYLEDHYFAAAGYTFDIGGDFQIEPSFLVKYANPAPIQFDFTGRFIYKKQIWLGGTFRTDDAISAMLGFTFRENLMFGYSYDFTTSNLQNYSTGTHELMIGVKFMGNKKDDGNSQL